MTQKEFSEKIGLTRTYWASIENGQRELPGNVIKLLAVTFNISSNWLLNGIGHPTEYGDLKLIKLEDQIDNHLERLDYVYNKIIQVIELREKAFGNDLKYDSYVNFIASEKQKLFKAVINLSNYDPKLILRKINELTDMFNKDFDELFNQYFLDITHPRMKESFKMPMNVVEIHL